MSVYLLPGAAGIKRNEEAVSNREESRKNHSSDPFTPAAPYTYTQRSSAPPGGSSGEEDGWKEVQSDLGVPEEI